MQNMLFSHRLTYATRVSGRPEDTLATAPWRFGALLLGLGIALVIIGAAFPEIFVGALAISGPIRLRPLRWRRVFSRCWSAKDSASSSIESPHSLCPVRSLA